jgi:hypothetical protein
MDGWDRSQPHRGRAVPAHKPLVRVDITGPGQIDGLRLIHLHNYTPSRGAVPNGPRAVDSLPTDHISSNLDALGGEASRPARRWS